MLRTVIILIFVWFCPFYLIGQSNADALRLLNDWKNISKPISIAELDKLDMPIIEGYKLYSQLFGLDLFLPIYCFKNLNLFPKMKYVVTQKSLNVVVVDKITDDLIYEREIYNKTISQFQPTLTGRYTPLYYFDLQESVANDFISRYSQFTVFPDCSITPTGFELVLIPFWSKEYSFGTVHTDDGELFVEESDFNKYPKDKIKDISSGFKNLPSVPIVSIIFNKQYSRALIELHWNFGSETSSSTILLIRKGTKWIFKKEGLVTS